MLSLILGDDCGKVVIWNMAPVRDEKFEKDDTIPKILCQMDNHLGEYLYPLLWLLIFDNVIIIIYLFIAKIYTIETNLK